MADTLSTAQHRAIVAVLGTKTLEQAAQQADCNVRTLRRWMADDAFAAALRTAESALLASAVRQLAATQAQAVTVLQEALGAARPADRIKAASALLSFAVTLRQSYVLEARLADLERRLLGGNDEGF